MDVLADFQRVHDDQAEKSKPKQGTTRAGKGFSHYIGDDEVGRHFKHA